MAKTAHGKIRIGIVGAGVIGGKRARIIRATRGNMLVAVADPDFARATALAREYGCEAMESWKSLVRRADIDVVVIAVPNKFVKPIAAEALKNGKHILAEKPFGRNASESFAILTAAKKYKRLVKVGFNHRFHPGILAAKKIFDKGDIGNILFIRARYGHGGRMGMEKEWRFNKDISGGGELLDQGVHLVDLARWFAGDFSEVYGLAETKFWNTKLDDNAFAILRNKKTTVTFHASTTNWKNIFSFEIFGETGFLTVSGLGGSYGVETLIFGKRKPTFGIPKIKEFRFERDTSWESEWKNFMSALRGASKMISDGKDGFEANRIIEAIYESSRRGRIIRL